LLDFLHVVKEGRFDTSIDLSLGYQYSLLLKFMGVAKRTGFDYRNRGKFLTHKVKIDWFRNKHVVEYYLDLLRFFDIDISDFDISPKVCIAPEDLKQAVRLLSENGVKGDSLVVGVIPGCGTSWGADAKYRRWPRENFAGVADGLIARYGAKVILFGDKNETSICDDIRRTMRNGVISLCGKTTIGEFLGLLSKCAFIITNDGGPLHMAAAIGLKTISIFGPVDEKVYGPYGPKEMHQVVCRTDMPCRPCYKNFKYTPCDERRCLNSLTVDNVMETVRRVLGR
jgi:lipopolysaccharide heptosyltransferase II